MAQVGKYTLIRKLAVGGMAEVFLARAEGPMGFAKTLVLKRILPHLAEDKQFVDMFLDEGRIAAQLAHPNVCQVYELGEAEGELFLAMEYLPGVDWEQLADAVPRDSILPLAAGVLVQACAGLHYAHGQKVIHRDVSPQNLFVTWEGSDELRSGSIGAQDRFPAEGAG